MGGTGKKLGFRRKLYVYLKPNYHFQISHHSPQTATFAVAATA